MTKIVVYCHGYGSSPRSEKVDRLRAVFPNTFSFELDVDPVESINEVSLKIDSILLSREYMNDEKIELVFVGTSLGAWYAETFARIYGAKCVVVNPCYDPANMLKKYGVPEELLSRYQPMTFDLPGMKAVFSKNDEVIDFKNLWYKIKADCLVTDKGDHRFGGPEFDMVIDLVKSI